MHALSNFGTLLVPTPFARHGAQGENQLGATAELHSICALA
jgi:hypothetical protein